MSFFVKFKNRKLNKILLFWKVLKTIRDIYLMVFHGGIDKVVCYFILCKIIGPNYNTYVSRCGGSLARNYGILMQSYK